jgi:hypothetical protein
VVNQEERKDFFAGKVWSVPAGHAAKRMVAENHEACWHIYYGLSSMYLLVIRMDSGKERKSVRTEKTQIGEVRRENPTRVRMNRASKSSRGIKPASPANLCSTYRGWVVLAVR